MRYLLIILSVFYFWSCSDPDLADPVTVDLNGEMKASLDGSEWLSQSNNSASANYLTNQIHIEGFLVEDNVIRSHITLTVNEVGAGTFDAQSATGIYYDVRTKTTYISENNCNLDITEFDLEKAFISGDFSFSAKDLESGKTVDVSNGEFLKVNLTIVE